MQSQFNKEEITILIPAYNEEHGIRSTLERLLEEYPGVKIIVVNDGSTDATAQVAQGFPSVLVLSHQMNRGYGAALKTAMMAAKTKFVLWYDADGQHQPESIAAVAMPVLKEECDACFGVRGRESAHVIKRAPGKWILRIVSQIIARQKIPDLNCGLRCFRLNVIKRYLHLLPEGFSASTTSTLIMIKRGYKIKFAPITTKARIGKSTVKIFRDGFSTLKLIARIMLLFDAFLFFSLLSATQIITAVVYSAVVIQREHNGIPILGALVTISGFLTFAMGMISAQISQMRQEQFEFRSKEE